MHTLTTEKDTTSATGESYAPAFVAAAGQVLKQLPTNKKLLVVAYDNASIDHFALGLAEISPVEAKLMLAYLEELKTRLTKATRNER